DLHVGRLPPTTDFVTAVAGFAAGRGFGDVFSLRMDAGGDQGQEPHNAEGRGQANRQYDDPSRQQLSQRTQHRLFRRYKPGLHASAKRLIDWRGREVRGPAVEPSAIPAGPMPWNPTSLADTFRTNFALTSQCGSRRSPGDERNLRICKPAHTWLSKSSRMTSSFGESRDVQYRSHRTVAHDPGRGVCRSLGE